jgi:CDGSH-type Zn-finger protein/uncharacterized Fe-S cluster protein YjdI
MENVDRSKLSHPLGPGSEAPPGSAAEEADLPIIKRYTSGDITVVWKPALCIHSKICWHGLPQVFNPRAKPWIKMDGAETRRIVAQVERCPSGALAIERAVEALNDAAGEVRVQVMRDGPLIVQGTQRIVLTDGREEVVETRAAYCRCGASAKKPFCDGSHLRIGFRDGAEPDISDQSATA